MEVSQHMEYLPFGETLVEEHLNSYNSPYKFNAKQYDAETGWYYYGARYYNPRWSIWLGVDPLAEKYPSLSPFAYVAQNPVIYIDPNGKEIKYHGDNTFWFNTGIKFRLFVQSIFGSKETRNLIKQLKTSDYIHTIKQRNNTYLRSNVQPRSLYDYEKAALENPIETPGINATQTEWDIHKKEMKEYMNNRPSSHSDGTGDGSYIFIDYEGNLKNQTENDLKEGPYKKTKTTILFHEFFHAKRIDDGNIGSNKSEEIKATQFTNKNFRNENNRREKYGDWDIPKEE